MFRRRHKPLRARYDVINYFVRKGNAKTYLEIGTSTGRCLDRVRCRQKTGVDPNPRETKPGWNIQKLTSDRFFSQNRSTFDVIFIDGLHLAEQVFRDIVNGMAALSPRGTLLLHDCNPLSEVAASRDVSLADGHEWNGDTWKAVAYVRRHHPDIFCRVLDVDQGIGIILPRTGQGRQGLGELNRELEDRARQYFDSIDWEDLQRDRTDLIGLIAGQERLERELEIA